MLFKLLVFARAINQGWRTLVLGVWRVIGKRYESKVLGGSGFAIAILIGSKRGYKFAELVARFAGLENVWFVGWGPVLRGGKGKWLISRANSFKSAANFALANIPAEKLLLVGQQFDLLVSVAQEFAKLPVGSAAVALDANGLITSAGTSAEGLVLRGFNVADLPSGFSPSGEFGVELVLGGKGFNWSQVKICYAVRVRYFKHWALPKGRSAGRLLSQPKAQRWAIKNPALANARGDRWGDTFFVQDLMLELSKLGLHVAEDRLENWNRPSRMLDDVELVIRGKNRYVPSGKSKSILWVISLPHLVTVDEVRDYDLVYSASESWAKSMSEKSGVPIGVLYQATNPARFNPRAFDAKLKSEVLFIGRTRKLFREVVKFAVQAKTPLTIYGEGWGEYIDTKYVKADFLSNDLVPVAYASCQILLNDHFDFMRDTGFISNRVFDAAACGARVLSDHIDGMPEVFGGLVKTYSDYETFASLVKNPKAWPSDAERKKLAAKVAEQHSFAARAKVLAAAVR